MAILKRQRTRKVRKIVKRTGIAYGAAMRLVKHMERWLVFENTIAGAPVEIPVYCNCCGPEHHLAKLVGPKGSIMLKDIRAL